MESSPLQEDGRQFYRALGDLQFLPAPGESLAKRGF